MTGKRLYRRLVEQMLELIDSGEYPVGSRLPAERELAERFGVSRPTIREAIIALEAIDRVAVKTGSGMYVTSGRGISRLDANISPFELLETRVVVEGEAAALAATLISEQQLVVLRQALDEMATENALHGLGSDSADRKFHLAVAEATNNPLLVSLIKELWDSQDSLIHIKAVHKAICNENPQLRLDEHRPIYDALARRDAPAARLAMRKHFKRAIDVLHQTVEEEAVEKVRRELLRTRERFSTERMASKLSSAAIAK